MHSSRMRTARSSSRSGGRGVSTRQPPEQTSPTPLGADTPFGADTPPPVDRITDACENITLPQLRCGR